VTLSSLLSDLRQELRGYGVVNPDVEAETIISHVLGLKRAAIYLDPSRILSPEQISRIRGIAGQRKRRFPLQYLTGEVEFMGLPLAIKPGVFIPRPETEILAEVVIGRARAMPGPPVVLDLATGSGALAIALAKYLEASLVLASDISVEAARLSLANARLNDVAGVVVPVVGDALDWLRPGSRFDIVVSNPPYVATSEIDGLQPEVRDFEPRPALDGGPEGLDFLARVLPHIPSILKETGIVAFEIGAVQAEAASGLFRRAGIGRVEVMKDLAGRDRIITGSGLQTCKSGRTGNPA
jgi:release factor glutamine methyltransferase